MSAKIVFVLCAQALLIQMALTQVVTSNLANSALAAGLGSGLGNILNSGNLASGALASGALASGALSSGVIVPTNSAAAVTGLTGLNAVAGGPLAVTSVSPIGPSGLVVTSENVLEGVLTVSGQLPFLSAVAFEGSLPTSGSGVATCGCGNGQVAITSEGLAGANLNGVGRL